MEYTTRSYPLFSACGLNCGLCPRFHTDGKSRCPGCAGSGFAKAHPPCGVLSCCQRKGLEYCYLCAEYPCKKYAGADAFDSFITHKNQLRDGDKGRRLGLEAYASELNEKIAILKKLLANYNDGRRKSFFCLAVNLLELPDIQQVMSRLAEEPSTKPLKEKSAAAVRLFEEAAQKQHLVLELRKRMTA